MKKRIKISLNRQSSLKNPLFGEISGVHHQKIALFDDTVIIGGANLSHNYFLNRRDRYMKLR
jgi:CDP-diacylglycerol--glycerol-3-phosphate 3-phosphatidyltransferase